MKVKKNNPTKTNVEIQLLLKKMLIGIEIILLVGICAFSVLFAVMLII